MKEDKEEKEDISYETLRNKLVKIHTSDWDWDINLDNLLRIDYSNIFGEVITIPVLENQVGRLLADLRNYSKEQKLKVEMKEAEVRKLFRNARSNEGGKPPTIQETDDHVTMDPIVSNLRFRLIRIEKDVEQIEALYDACKSKSFKLNNLSKSITPEGFEKQLVEGRINGVLISLKEKHYK